MHPNQSDMQKDSAITFILHHFRDSYKILPGNLFSEEQRRNSSFLRCYEEFFRSLAYLQSSSAKAATCSDDSPKSFSSAAAGPE